MPTALSRRWGTWADCQ